MQSHPPTSGHWCLLEDNFFLLNKLIMEFKSNSNLLTLFSQFKCYGFFGEVERKETTLCGRFSEQEYVGVAGVYSSS